MRKRTFWHMRPTKTQISLRIRCPHGETLHPWLSKMRPVKILIRLRDCADWSESSLGARTKVLFMLRFYGPVNPIASWRAPSEDMLECYMSMKQSYKMWPLSSLSHPDTVVTWLKISKPTLNQAETNIGASEYSLLNGLHQAKKCLWTCAKCAEFHRPAHAQVSSRHLLSIEAFFSIQWFRLQTAKALIRLHGCAGWFWPSAAQISCEQLIINQWLECSNNLPST